MAFKFQKDSTSLTQVMMDHKLASLGDAFVNFACSLALSNRTTEPIGMKVKGSILAEALRKSGLRECLGFRLTRHELADAAEALLVYGWLKGHITLDESVKVLEETAELADGFTTLLKTVRKKATFP